MDINYDSDIRSTTFVR